jgi:hypothetical protein
MERRSLLALVALLLSAPVTVAAAPCRPSSAELAYEELMEAAEDDSPAEADARRVADEQEIRGEFESERTIDLLEEVAARWDLVYHCATRTYRPVGAPEPAPGEDPDDLDDDEDAEDGADDRLPGPTGSTGSPGTGGAPADGRNGGVSGPAPGAGSDSGGVSGSAPGAGANPGGDVPSALAGDDNSPVPGGGLTQSGKSTDADSRGGARAGTTDRDPVGEAIPVPDALDGTASAILARDEPRPLWPVALAGAALVAVCSGMALRLRRLRRCQM